MAEGPRIFKTTYRTPVHVTPQAECMIVPLWQRGYDTLAIAQKLSLPEYEVANRLLRLRDLAEASHG